MFARSLVPPLQLNLQSEIAALVGKLILVNTAKLVSVVTNMRTAKVEYKLGAKAPSLKSLVSDIKQIDCSGFVRYAMYQATSGAVIMPDGSWNQDDWCRKQGFAAVNYQKTAGTLDHRLRIAFMHGGIGHVWFVLDGQTIESRGHVGPSRRDWQTPILFNHACKCYLLTA